MFNKIKMDDDLEPKAKLPKVAKVSMAKLRKWLSNSMIKVFVSSPKVQVITNTARNACMLGIPTLLKRDNEIKPRLVNSLTTNLQKSRKSYTLT